MKLLLLADARSIHTQKWASYFADRGHRVDVLSFRNAEIPNVTVHRLRAFIPGKLARLTAISKVRKLIDVIGPDIVHAHYATSYGLLGSLTGFHPLVISVWGSDVFEFPRKSYLHRKLLQFNLAKADHVCSTSNIMAREARKYCDRPISVTPFGIDCTRFRPSPSGGDPSQVVIGTVKSGYWYYGAQFVISSFSLLRNSVKPEIASKLRLVIAGDGPYNRSLKRLVNKLGIQHATEFVGNVPHAAMPALLNTFSISATLSERESFGVAVIEASACGIPVVVSNSEGLPEVVENDLTGIIVPSRDVEAAAHAFRRLIDDPHLRKTMGANGRDYVLKNYNWIENASRLERVYEALIANVTIAGSEPGYCQH